MSPSIGISSRLSPPCAFWRESQEIQMHIWEARHAIEREIARLAAIRGSESDIAEIGEVVKLAEAVPRPSKKISH